MSRSIHAIGLALFAATGLASQTASAEIIVGITTANRIVTFNSSNPGTILNSFVVSGLNANDRVLGIDFRPATGEVIAIGETNQLYSLNVGTGAATPIGTGFTPGLEGSPLTRYGIDINPTVDRVRVVGSNAQNRRLNPVNGTAVVTSGNPLDTALTYNPPSTSLIAPRAVATAYTNSVAGAPLGSTRQFILDSFTGGLGEVGSQAGGNASFNGGVVTQVGLLGVSFDDNAGFDISGFTGVAFASLNVRNQSGPTGLYTLNLATGAASLLGSIGGGESIRDITVIPSPGTGVIALAGLVAVRRRRRA